MSFELGEAVRPSLIYIKWSRKKHPKINPGSTGKVVGYKSPVKLPNGTYMGRVMVKWTFEGPGVLYTTIPMRWDEIERC
jgi:hypothetical protein